MIITDVYNNKIDTKIIEIFIKYKYNLDNKEIFNLLDKNINDDLLIKNMDMYYKLKKCDPVFDSKIDLSFYKKEISNLFEKNINDDSLSKNIDMYYILKKCDDIFDSKLDFSLYKKEIVNLFEKNINDDFSLSKNIDMYYILKKYDDAFDSKIYFSNIKKNIVSYITKQYDTVNKINKIRDNMNNIILYRGKKDKYYLDYDKRNDVNIDDSEQSNMITVLILV